MAVGMIETVGYPAVLAAACHVKKPRAWLVNYESCARAGRYELVSIRGPVAKSDRPWKQASKWSPNSGDAGGRGSCDPSHGRLRALFALCYAATAEPFRITTVAGEVD
jgi:hypothetical protein